MQVYLEGSDDEDLDAESKILPTMEEGDILKLNNPDLQPFYSRSINDPAFALKLLNQGKKSRLFYLSSLDSNSPYLIAGRDRSYFGEGKKSFVNVLNFMLSSTSIK